MADFPHMAWYPRDYIADTRHLTPEQKGAYTDLLNYAWLNKAELVDNDDELARMCGFTLRRWMDKIRPAMERFWTIENGIWIQERQQKQFHSLIKKVSKNRENAALGGKAKALNANKSHLANASETLERKSAITAREEPEPYTERKKEGESSTLSSTRVDSSDQMIAIWVDELPTLSKPRKITPQRRQKLNARLKDFCEGDLQLWRQACQRVAQAPHLCGDNDRGWTASLDWVLEPRNLTKILEGNYDARQPVERKPTEPKGVMADAKRILQRAAAARDRRDYPTMGRNGEEQRANGEPGGGAVAVLPDGREVPLHGSEPDDRPMDRGKPLVPGSDQGLRGRATAGQRPCDAAARKQERPMARDQEQLDPDLGEAIGDVVSATSWPS